MAEQSKQKQANEQQKAQRLIRTLETTFRIRTVNPRTIQTDNFKI